MLLAKKVIEKCTNSKPFSALLHSPMAFIGLGKRRKGDDQDSSSSSNKSSRLELVGGSSSVPPQLPSSISSLAHLHDYPPPIPGSGFVVSPHTLAHDLNQTPYSSLRQGAVGLELPLPRQAESQIQQQRQSDRQPILLQEASNLTDEIRERSIASQNVDLLVALYHQRNRQEQATQPLSDQQTLISHLRRQHEIQSNTSPLSTGDPSPSMLLGQTLPSQSSLPMSILQRRQQLLHTRSCMLPSAGVTLQDQLLLRQLSDIESLRQCEMEARNQRRLLEEQQQQLENHMRQTIERSELVQQAYRQQELDLLARVLQLRQQQSQLNLVSQSRIGQTSSEPLVSNSDSTTNQERLSEHMAQDSVDVSRGQTGPYSSSAGKGSAYCAPAATGHLPRQSPSGSRGLDKKTSEHVVVGDAEHASVMEGEKSTSKGSSAVSCNTEAVSTTTAPKPLANGGIPMTQVGDKSKLSMYQRTIRDQLEFFVAEKVDTESSKQGRKRSVTKGQIGIRCKHCAHVPLSVRNRGAVYYPAKLTGVYQAAQNMSSSHLTDSCTYISQSTKVDLIKLRDRRDSAVGGKAYWVDACIEMGLYETEHGLKLKKEK